MDISIVQANPDDVGEILALQKMAYKSEAKLNDDWTIKISVRKKWQVRTKSKIISDQAPISRA
jgi:hypothetical protein